MMAQATVSIYIGQRYGLPPFSEDADFDQWCFEVEMLKLVTDLKLDKQGPMVFLSFSPKIRQAWSALSKDDSNDFTLTGPNCHHPSGELVLTP